MPSVLTLFSIFLMIATMVDWHWASYPDIDPVASTQKQTSTNPNAGKGRLSLELVLKIVAFEGLIERSILRALMILEPVEAGGATAIMGAGRGTAGIERAGLPRLPALLIVVFFLATVYPFLVFLGFTI